MNHSLTPRRCGSQTLQAQEEITLPAPNAALSGECGSWYPGVDSPDATYGFEVGATAPCLVWESARVGPRGEEPNTYPQWFLVRVSDMRVIAHQENANYQDVLALVQEIETLWPASGRRPPTAACRAAARPR